MRLTNIEKRLEDMDNSLPLDAQLAGIEIITEIAHRG